MAVGAHGLCSSHQASLTRHWKPHSSCVQLGLRLPATATSSCWQCKRKKATKLKESKSFHWTQSVGFLSCHICCYCLLMASLIDLCLGPLDLYCMCTNRKSHQGFWKGEELADVGGVDEMEWGSVQEQQLNPSTCSRDLLKSRQGCSRDLLKSRQAHQHKAILFNRPTTALTREGRSNH